MARRAKVFGLDDGHGVPVYSRRSYRKFLSLIGAMLLGRAGESLDLPAFLAHLRTVRDRLAFFLEMIDRCDVLFSEERDGRLVFLVLTDEREHVPLIANAIAQEKGLLEKLGIDAHAIDVHRDMIRVSVPMPEHDRLVLH